MKEPTHAYAVTGNEHSMLANRVSYFLNFKGPSETIDTACSSALVAIHRAVTSLQNKECTLAIAGGANLMLNPKTLVMISQLGILSPDGKCRTFDKGANGYVKGEGIGAVLLKPLIQAELDGDPIYGVIRASAVNHGGKAQSLMAPNSLAQAQLIEKVYNISGVDPSTTSYIEVHGTGTALGDPVEIEGLKQAFAHFKSTVNKIGYCGLGSIKTNMGHLETAAGVVGVIKVLLAMKHGEIPGNLHFTELNPYIDIKNSPFYIIEETQEWKRLKDGQQTIPFAEPVSVVLVLAELMHMFSSKKIPFLKLNYPLRNLRTSLLFPLKRINH